MKFTLSWLKRFLDTTASLDEICNALNNLGLEVEEVSDRSKELKDFKIARIIEANPHPQANKLQVCKVNDGEKVLQIICGAANARKDLTVVLAPVGTVIPENGLVIELAQIRGIESQGMLCGADELQVGGFNDEGIIELPADLPIGVSFATEYGLDDPVITLGITPNRADCFGVYGIARDLAAKGLGKLKEIAHKEIEFLKDSKSEMRLQLDQKLSNLFIGCQIRNIQNKPSPRWLANMLSNVGIQPISTVVDITNYMCHSFAQPMHAFDHDRLGNNIIIRTANEREKFKALNEKEYSLNIDDIVLANDKQVCLLAGIMGGIDSACTMQTQNIFLEAALYDKNSIAKSSKRHKIITDAKMRFERHVDGHKRLDAFKLACSMIQEICGGEFYNLLNEGTLKEPKTIKFDFSLVKDKSGLDIPIERSVEILEKLGYKITQSNHVIVPTWRDSEIPEDLVEEIVRVYGYDHVGQEPLTYTQHQSFPENFQIASKLSAALVSRGYHEVVTWSFMQDAKASKFGDINKDLEVVNPISNELNYMRGSILPNLLDNVIYNQNNFIKNIKIFEIGPVFNGNQVKDEGIVLSALYSGEYSNLPHEKSRLVDIFDIKGDLEYILQTIGIKLDDIDKMQDAYLHPNISGNIIYNDKTIGYIGSVHPKLLKEYDVTGEVFYFELNLNELSLIKEKAEFVPYAHPPVNRDFAFVVDEDIRAGDIVSHIKNNKLLPIKEVNIFDIYTGDQIGSNKKSIAINVTIQTNTNLTSEQIDLMSQNIINSVVEEFKATLRQ
ncbi:phenylalanyl-tRNA synthetase subunit beta [Candidatus Phycorickettsia trachydisci]|uniref:Phenylalanine--tRNA ligase beta subunit n=1 Tax=Candidatus Phycorickettsia trachydisci TaxID=2115978 RepID=A0A2P1P7D7_9RICK|nr:phenylalanine--tRNA ligase subunit beta [Candidatus Phycorickettsia trachydisci]AVP87155.1 phenylalanyl-tRNA synthetase subunit beta [Candidatus Phycorickettsia trachydisci]